LVFRPEQDQYIPPFQQRHPGGIEDHFARLPHLQTYDKGLCAVLHIQVAQELAHPRRVLGYGHLFKAEYFVAFVDDHVQKAHHLWPKGKGGHPHAFGHRRGDHPICPSLQEFVYRLFVLGPGDDIEVGVHPFGRDHQKEVIRIGGEQGQ